MGSRALEGDDLAKAKDDMKGDMVAVLRGLDGLQCQALEPREVEGVMCLPVHVTGAGDGYQIFFLDPANHHVVMVQQPGVSPMTQAPVTQKIIVDEYGELGGVAMPVKMQLTYDDELFGTIAVEAFEPNASVDDGLFVQ
jgi:hypothetical protein